MITMHRMKWALVAAVGAALVATAGVRDQDLPRNLAGYRSWTELTPGPVLMPLALAVQCMPVTTIQFEHAEKSHGPHTKVWSSVYANPIALEALKSTDAKRFPAGAVIAKMKLRKQTDTAPSAVAFMIKHGKGEFAESGGWEFAYYPVPGSRASYERCVNCHREGGSKDYVFSVLRP